ncbi:hypothetical protein ATANTOWER_029190 [Ataeniobius toweri]|uniref:Uncharacterized protein n=1 Tax=Ataeniobius toweri TaxID=208326 RepID=A0ABU7C4R7_9TELE|nr:hypothetical protein [Ataeniobius toweri]
MSANLLTLMDPGREMDFDHVTNVIFIYNSIHITNCQNGNVTVSSIILFCVLFCVVVCGAGHVMSLASSEQKGLIFIQRSGLSLPVRGQSRCRQGRNTDNRG